MPSRWCSRRVCRPSTSASITCARHSARTCAVPPRCVASGAPWRSSISMSPTTRVGCAPSAAAPTAHRRARGRSMYRPPYDPDPHVSNLGDIVDPDAPDDRPWVIDVEPDGRAMHLTYGEARAQIDAVARGLARRSLKRGDSVGMLSANRTEMLIAYFAIMRAGFVAVPINHKLAPPIIEHIVKDSAIALMYADAERAAVVPPGLPVIPMDSAAP